VFDPIRELMMRDLLTDTTMIMLVLFGHFRSQIGYIDCILGR
jgi:hypothetical protein